MKKYIYLCGPTVYDKVHIGNMRPIVTFDLILRGYKHLYPDQYVFIHNITDIDDKIINQAQKLKMSESEISSQYFSFYKEMLKEYNVQTIDKMPKVTEHINEIASFIQNILNNKNGYEVNKSIYFDTSKFSQYGSVSNINLEKLQNQKTHEQKNDFDFVLWKNKKEGMTWETSIGNGRPGWHTECAVFVNHYTKGQSLEIHGGGIDLKFPHHENENIQYIAVNNKPITTQWLHTGTINIDNQKMSKSLGNIIKADQFLSLYPHGADLFRLLILTSNINAEIEINDTVLQPLIKKIHQLDKIMNYLKLNESQLEISYDQNQSEIYNNIAQEIIKYSFAQISKNLNKLIKQFNESKNIIYAQEIYSYLKFLGFNLVNKTIDKELISLYHEYKTLLSKKEYDKSDEIRKKLLKHNLI
ncbi:class I tRNA ligase family protein [Metamycoplasma sualvi]|uniref:class I tRNA ligase family protein n=1 Tax=Metamycoplasma sualvi TaxID=2125 RepID=UPI003872B6ED